MPSLKQQVRAELGERLTAKKAFQRQQTDLWSKVGIYFASSLAVLVSLAIVVFLIVESVTAFHDIGFFQFIFGSTWQADNNQFGLWPFLVATFWVLIIALLIDVPLTLLGSVFITEFLPSKLQKTITSTIEILAGVPSVVFGLFGLEMLGNIFQGWGAPTNANMLVASIVLAFMALPTMMSLSINALKAVPHSYRYAALALGLSKTYTSWRVVRKAAKVQMIGAIIAGMGRVIGETMAVMLIAGGGTSTPDFNHGFIGWIFSSVRTLASAIGIEIGEAHTGLHQSALYAIGIVLFILVTIINLAILAVYRWPIWKQRLYRTKMLRRFGTSPIAVGQFNYRAAKDRIHTSLSKQTYKKSKDGFLWSLMLLATTITVAFTAWVIIDIIVQGIMAFDQVHIIHTSAGADLVASFLTTIFLIIVSLIISLPLAILVAIYLSEYAHDNWFKRALNFALDTLLSTPSIVYGMFGLVIFISLFGLPLSILTAGLTLTLLVLPVMIKSIANSLQAVPQSYRYAALALGATKTKTVFKVVLPNAKAGIVTGTILAMGRIAGESAPVYLTLGTTAVLPHWGLLSPGRTLTTAILLLVREGLTPNAIQLAYQAAFIVLILILVFNLLAKSTSYLISAKGTSLWAQLKTTVQPLLNRKNNQ